jgi:hypothetical protein
MRAVQVNCGRWLPQSDWDRFATSNSAAQCYIESPRNNDIFSFVFCKPDSNQAQSSQIAPFLCRHRPKSVEKSVIFNHNL